METKKVQWFDDRFYRMAVGCSSAAEAEELQTRYTKAGLTVYIDKDDVLDIYLPSVTTILGAVAKPALARWRGDIGNREADLRSQEAMDKGTNIHHACEMYMRGGAVLLQPRFSPNFNQAEVEAIRMEREGKVFVLEEQEQHLQVQRFVRWMDTIQPEVLGIEEELVSLNLRCGGTMDYALFIKGGKYSINGSKPLELEEGIYVCDLKSGKSLDDSYDMQISAYVAMYSEKLTKEQQAMLKGGLLIHTNAQTRTGIEGLATKLITMEDVAVNLSDFAHVQALWFRHNSFSPKVFNLPAMLAKDNARK